MIKDKETLDNLIPAVIDLSKNEQKQADLMENIGRLGVKDADIKIAQEIFSSLK